MPGEPVVARSGAVAESLVAVAAVTASQTIVSMGVATLPVIAPRLAEDLGVDASLIGFQVGIAYGAGAIGALVAGGLVQRLGACRATQASLLVSAAGCAVAIAVPGFVSLAVASLLIGAALGLVTPPAAHLIVRFVPPSQYSLVFSVKQTGVPLGFMLAALSAPAIALGPGWRWSLALVCACTIALAAALQLRRRRWDDDRARPAVPMHSPLAGIRYVWQRPLTRRIVLAGSCYAAIQVCVATFTVNLLVREGGFGLVHAGALVSLMNVAGAIGRVIWGWIADRFHAGAAVLAAIGAVMAASCLALATIDLGGPRIALQLLLVALGASAIGWNGILHAEIARLTPPERAGLASSGTSFFVFGSICVTPVAASLLYPWFGSYALLFGALSVFGGLGLAFIAAAQRTRE